MADTTKTVSSRQTARARRGVSLLEIMISIGVVGIGLLGVASLIPLAHFKATEGVQEERKALFGKRAFREFFVRGFNKPGRGTSGRFPGDPSQQRPNWIHVGPGSVGNIFDREGRLLPQTYCFDPQGIAHQFDVGAAGAFHFFPSNTALQIHVPRVTVRDLNANAQLESLILQGQRQGLNQIDAVTTATVNFNSIISRPSFLRSEQANEIFQLRDDLVVTQPTTTDQLPMMSYLIEGTPIPTVPTKAATAGSFSWMATVVPERHGDFFFPTVPVSANRFVLSIVVFNRRDLSGAYREETVALVDPTVSLFSGGLKEILINELDPAEPLQPNNVGVRDIRARDWIALMQNPTGTIPPGTSFASNRVELRWYQVAAADENDGDFDVSRELSLTGPDWAPIPSVPIYAVYLRNVAAVYEKTVELDLD